MESLFDASFQNGADHPLSLSLTEEIPFLKKQTRLTFAHCGVIDPHSLKSYE